MAYPRDMSSFRDEARRAKTRLQPKSRFFDIETASRTGGSGGRSFPSFRREGNLLTACLSSGRFLYNIKTRGARSR